MRISWPLLAMAASVELLAPACASPPVCARTVAPRHLASTPDPSPNLWGDRLIEAVGCGGLAWVRTETGALKTVDPLGHVSQEVSRFVLDVHRSTHGDLWLLHDWSGRGGPSASVSVARHDQEHFTDLTAITLDTGETPLAVADVHGAPVVVSDTRLYLWNEQAWSSRTLRPPLTSVARATKVSAAAAENGRTLYVGLDRGEFGAGLRAIDVRTGAVATIGMPTSRFDVTNPPNADNDTITAVITDPSEDDCVLASSGLGHMGSWDGRVIRACGTSMRVVLRRELARGSEAFYGLAADGNSVWAVTRWGVFLIGPSRSTYGLLDLMPNASGIYRAAPHVLVICAPGGCGEQGPVIANIR